jgi:GMP synthase-like glutamine amidotransferase
MTYEDVSGKKSLHFTLLQADYVNSDLLTVHGDLPEMFKSFLSRIWPDFSLEVFTVYKDVFPNANHKTDCFIISGSRCSVNDSSQWIRNLEKFILAGYKKHKFLGICFGHQILAKSLGSDIAPVSGGWNVGARQIELDLLDGTDQTLEQSKPWMVFNHSQEVQSLPSGCRQIGTSAPCIIPAFIDYPWVLGIQGHPEYSTAYQEALMTAQGERIPEDLRFDALNRNALYQFSADLEILIYNFVLAP